MSFRQSPLAWLVTAFIAFELFGLTWGLPASDGWDNDGVAPRDILVGVALTFTPGRYFTYPPVYLVMVTLLTAPVSVVIAIKAAAFTSEALVAEALKVPYMTAIALVARSLTLVMACAAIVALARMARELFGKRAGLFTAAFAALNVAFVYYARTSNLDVPAFCFGAFGVLEIVRALVRSEPRRLRRVAVFAALAVGTKDQVYGLFLLSLPVILAFWPFVEARFRAVDKRAYAKALGMLLVFGLGTLVIVDAIIFNPKGFAARVAFLRGPASQDFALYTKDWAGRAAVVRDAVAFYPRFYPALSGLLVVVGLVRSMRPRADRAAPPLASTEPTEGTRASVGARRLAAWVPFLCAVSFVVTFNCVARRTEHRFLLPPMMMLAFYGGVGADWLFSHANRGVRWLGRTALVGVVGLALFGASSVTANIVLDPRYDAEAWLREHVKPGDTIETYGLNVYLPRFPAGARVVRVGPEAPDRRNPMPTFVEVQEPFGNAEQRAPRFIVVSQGWIWRYLLDPSLSPHDGRMIPPGQIRGASTNTDATTFFSRLVYGQTPFRFVHKSAFTSSVFPKVSMHSSTAQEIWIYERTP